MTEDFGGGKRYPRQLGDWLVIRLLCWHPLDLTMPCALSAFSSKGHRNL